jgi:hypothetical protein
VKTGLWGENYITRSFMGCNHTKHHKGDLTMDEKGRTCSTYGENRNTHRLLARKLQENIAWKTMALMREQYINSLRGGRGGGQAAGHCRSADTVTS